MKLAHVTKTTVADALQSAETLGDAAFCSLHGYRQSTAWVVRWKGRSYSSKAVLGVAAGLKPADFFGGVAQTIPTLRRLGFDCRHGERAAGVLGLEALAQSRGFDNPLPRWPVNLSAYFASGSNRPAEIRGLANVGQDIGVAITELSSQGADELRALAGTDVQVFADSGAFSEVDRELQVVNPISSEDWTGRLLKYHALADALGDQLHVVAPDRVGDQAHTLRLLAEFAPMLRRIANTGARILVPMQKGSMSQAGFAQVVEGLLFGIAWIPAFPCNKGATQPFELASFLDARPATVQVHLLGIGVFNRNLGDYLAACVARNVGVQTDSNLLASQLGRSNGPGGSPRRYTAAQDDAQELVDAGRLPKALKKALAFLLLFGVC